MTNEPFTEPFLFSVKEGEELTLKEAVGQAVGAASVCWDNLDGAGVFQSERAIEIVDALLKFIEKEPYLGLATTEELLGEVIVRLEIVGMAEPDNADAVAGKFSAQLLLGTLPTNIRKYRTVDSE